MWRVVAVVWALVGTAVADPVERATTTRVAGGSRVLLGMPKIVYLNRCRGNCEITAGEEDDARQSISRIPFRPGVHQVTEFALGDEVWTAFVGCMREVWSPYGLTFTESRPSPTEVYGEAVIAGTDREVDVFGAAGIAPIDEFCRPLAYAISYTFANQWLEYGLGDDTAVDLCSVASQEIAHTYGLDHSFQFFEGDSSCSDPMTYRADCGGQKFFRNRLATCGEYEERVCRCGPNQQSHSLLLGKLGAGTPITTTDVSITSPSDGTTINNNATVIAEGFSQRGIVEIAFRLNGYPWTTLPGAPFGPRGQLRSNYLYTLPADVPDGVIDIEVEAIDDIGVSSVSEITVTKGAPCASEDSCAAGQFCDAGRCIWPEPIGNVGDACTYAQFCVEPRCDTHGGESHCTRTCVAGLEGACEAGLACVDDPAGAYCWPVAEGGCCSTSRELPWGALVLGGFVAFLVGRRRR